MRSSRIVHVVSVIVLLAFTSSALSAAEDGWKLPNLNPFAKKTNAKKKKKPSRATVSDRESGIHLPKMPAIPKPSLPSLGSNSKRKRSASKEPSTVTKMTQGTKNFFAKSYDVLTPWDNDSKERSTNKRNSSPRIAKKDDSWFDFSHKDDEHEIEAVDDFLKMPRPEY